MLTLQEAKDSSEIENIVTTQDEIFKAELFETNISLDTKEVQNYIQALKVGFNNVTRHNILTTNHILDIQENLEKNRAGFRTSKGTVLKNNKNEIVYSPPQNYADILLLMNNLEQYINDDEICSLDPLIKMAIVHHQFESIHPFYDGNGRTGRIINILYLRVLFKES
jgi:Fic family protein